MFERLIVVIFVSLVTAFAQEAPVSHPETVQELVSRLTPEQKQRLDAAMQYFNTQHYAEASGGFRQLLREVKGDPVLSKFAAEASLNTGEVGDVLTVIKPIAEADPNDWQAAGLLTRACAESGEKPCRDSGMSHMMDLYHRGVIPASVRLYPVEHVKAGENTLIIKVALEPAGPYKIYYKGQVVNPDGKVYLQMTLESSDGDQTFFAREHKKEAAEGLRGFSLDAYQETGLNNAGQRTQTHYTFSMLVGQPPYDTLRDEFIKIATGKISPISKRTGLIVP